MSNQEQHSAAGRFLGLLQPIESDLENYARRMVFDRRDFEDALQNAVLRAFRAFDRYHDDASFRAWMFKILTNEIFAINRKRGRVAQFEVAVDPEAIEEFAGLEFASEALKKCAMRSCARESDRGYEMRRSQKICPPLSRFGAER